MFQPSIISRKSLITIAAILAVPLVIAGQTDSQQQLLDSLAAQPVRDTQYVNWLNQLAYSYWNSEPRKTDSLGMVALTLSDELGYQKGRFWSYHKLSIGQWMLGDYPLAFEYATEMLKIAENGDFSDGVTSAYSMMALITEDQGLLQESLNYHQRALAYHRARRDSVGIGKTLNNMGSVYWQMQKLDSSLLLFQQAYEIRKTTDTERSQRESLSNIAFVLNEQNKPEAAMPIAQRTLAIATKMNDLNGILNIQETIGNIHVNLNQLDSAEAVYFKALEMAQQMGVNKRVIDLYGRLANLYKTKNNFPLAYDYLDRYWVLKDSIEGQEAANELSRLQAQYESEKKGNEISKLQNQNRVNLILRNAFALGSVVTLIFAFLLYRFFRFRQKKNLELIEAKDQQTRQLEEVNTLKSRFLANLSHEFRTPLTLILGPSEQLLADKPDGPEKQQLSWIYNNSRKLLKLINQLLDLSKVEAGKLDLKATQMDLVQFCRYIISAFDSLAEQKGIRVTVEAPAEQIYLYFDPEKLEQVLNNLVNNAMKFTEEGQIQLRLETVVRAGREYAEITLSDSGSGIHVHHLPHIFDRFYQASQDTPSALEGTGIGLALTKELIELHSGIIEVESQLGLGTRFRIYLPLGRDHLQDEEITLSKTDWVSRDPILPLPEPTPAPDPAADGEEGLPLVLVLDDNQDMLDYLQVQLQGDFRILKAQTGETALEIAGAELPDLIISDVMMPGMSGYEFCTRIKNDPATDHIPVILLTARTGESYKIRGLEIQADDYIQKPFNRNELSVRITNLITNRKRLQKRFQEISLLQVPEVTENPREAQFLEQLFQVLEAHLNDPQLDVNTLGKAVGLSKSQLNRKTKAILDKSPNQLIRSYRLERARQLIKSTDFTLAEIAYDVGFSSPAYFSKCFHDEFGFPPSAVNP